MTAYLAGSSSTCHFFYVRSHLKAAQNGHAITSTNNLKVLSLEQPSSQFTLWIVYWDIFWKIFYSCGEKMCLFCVAGFGVFYQKVHSLCLNIKGAHKYLGNLYVYP